MSDDNHVTHNELKLVIEPLMRSHEELKSEMITYHKESLDIQRESVKSTYELSASIRELAKDKEHLACEVEEIKETQKHYQKSWDASKESYDNWLYFKKTKLTPIILAGLFLAVMAALGYNLSPQKTQVGESQNASSNS